MGRTADQWCQVAHRYRCGRLAARARDGAGASRGVDAAERDAVRVACEDRDVGWRAEGAREREAADREATDSGPPVEQGAIAGLRARCQREVDEVLVEAHRGNQHVAVRHAEAVEQAVVDDDVALHAPNAGGVHLAGQFIDGGQRIFRRQARAVEGMGLVMVEVGVVQRGVRSRPATEGQVAGRHQDEIARQHAARDRTGKPVFRSGGRRRGCRARRPRRTACAPNR